jgi:hypothetical protein
MNKYITKTVMTRSRFFLDLFLYFLYLRGSVDIIWIIVSIIINSIVNNLLLLFVLDDLFLWLLMLLMLVVEVKWFHKKHKRDAC